MENKKTLILVGITALLILVLIFQKSCDRNQTPVIPKLQNEITLIEIEQNSNKTSIQNVNNEWLINNVLYPADIQQVSRMLTSLENIKLFSHISTKENDERYDLDENSVITVKAYSNNSLLRTVYLGKNSSSGNQVYIKIDNDKSVYLVKNNMRAIFSKSVEELRNKNIMNFDSSIFNSIQIENFNDNTSNANFKLIKNANTESSIGTKWVVEKRDEFKLDQNKVLTYLRTLNSNYADSFTSDNEFPTEMDYKFTFEVIDKKYTLKIVQVGEENYLCQYSESEYLFILKSHVINRFIKTITDLQ